MNNENSGNEAEGCSVIPLSPRNNARDTSINELEDFVGAFDEDDVQNRINQAIETCLTTDNYHFAKPIDREELLYIMRHIGKAVSALYILFGKKVA